MLLSGRAITRVNVVELDFDVGGRCSIASQPSGGGNRLGTAKIVE